MKIAVLADLHLGENHPERYEDFQATLSALREKVTTIILAGDVFDEHRQEFKTFETILDKYREIDFHLIRGNHDKTLRSDFFQAENLSVYDSPEIKLFDESEIVFLPYTADATMGQALMRAFPGKTFQNSLLISHGDFGSTGIDSEETGYFPLTRQEVASLKLHRVILGHIHEPGERKWPVLYCGSPWPISRKETGQRFCLLYDTATREVELLATKHKVVYKETSVFLIPGKENEAFAKLQETLSEARKTFPQNELLVTASVYGYTNLPAKKMESVIRDSLKNAGARLHKLETDVKFDADEDLTALADEAIRLLGDYKLPQEIRQRSSHYITEFIFGGGLGN